MKKIIKILISIIILIIILVIVYLIFINKNNKIKTSKYKPDDTIPYKETINIENPHSENEESIELKYDEYVVANGFAGASNHVYYTRGNNLYHLEISSDTHTLLATGVKNIKEDMDTVLVYKNNNFKIVNEDNYVTYVN